MKVLIVEDEHLSVERLSKQLNEIDESITIVGVTDSIFQTIDWLRNNTPELILMDIELADGQSFDIFKMTQVDVPVIFTTSYDEFALEAFKVNSVDYLLKPINKPELAKALDKYKSYFERPKPVDIEKLLQAFKVSPPQEYRSRFLIKTGQKYQSVETTDIAYFNLEDRVTMLVTAKGRFVIDYTIEDLELMLDPKHFYRATRSFIVNIKAIVNVQVYFGGKLELILMPPAPKEVIISRDNVSDFKRWMGK